MQHVGRVDVLEASEDLVEEVADVVVAQPLGLQQLVQIRLHQSLNDVAGSHKGQGRTPQKKLNHPFVYRVDGEPGIIVHSMLKADRPSQTMCSFPADTRRPDVSPFTATLRFNRRSEKYTGIERPANVMLCISFNLCKYKFVRTDPHHQFRRFKTLKKNSKIL